MTTTSSTASTSAASGTSGTPPVPVPFDMVTNLTSAKFGIPELNRVYDLTFPGPLFDPATLKQLRAVSMYGAPGLKDRNFSFSITEIGGTASPGVKIELNLETGEVTLTVAGKTFVVACWSSGTLFFTAAFSQGFRGIVTFFLQAKKRILPRPEAIAIEMPCPFACATDRLKKFSGDDLAADPDAGLWEASDFTGEPWTLTFAFKKLTRNCTKGAFVVSCKKWSDVCGIKFREVGKKTAMFVVRDANQEEEEWNSGTLARSFFPNDFKETKKADIVCYRSMKGHWNQVGIMTHELGHVLGFRHEHIWARNNPTGEPPGRAYRINDAPYDLNSIMNYLKMWDDISRRRISVLSTLDKVGANFVYPKSR